MYRPYLVFVSLIHNYKEIYIYITLTKISEGCNKRNVYLNYLPISKITWFAETIHIPCTPSWPRSTQTLDPFPRQFVAAKRIDRALDHTGLCPTPSSTRCARAADARDNTVSTVNAPGDRGRFPLLCASTRSARLMCLGLKRGIMKM